MIPASGKVVVFDHDLPVKYAFYGLLEHHIKCAPIWDSVKMDFVGMLTVTDFIDILRHFYHQDKLADLSNILGNQCIREWACKFDSGEMNPNFDIPIVTAIKSLLRLSVPHLLTTDPECTLLEALEIFSRNRINRLPVLQKEPENSILCLLTHQRILNFLLVKVLSFSLFSFVENEMHFFRCRLSSRRKKSYRCCVAFQLEIWESVRFAPC